jgi:diguanylate cyclase (GGDEF)-like protein/PAS domain S-box-containing protein
MPETESPLSPEAVDILLVDGLERGVGDWDIREDSLFLNRAWWRLIGYDEPSGYVSHQDVWSRIHPDDRTGLLEAYRDALAGPDDMLGYTLRLARQDGSWLRAELKARLIRDDAGRVERVVGSFSDVSDLLDRERRLEQLSRRDRTTGLLNYDGFCEAVESYRRQIPADRVDALVHLDVQRFRDINSSLGHELADRLLRRCAARIKAFFGADVPIGRIGADEFVVFQADVTDREATKAKLDDFLTVFRSAFTIGDRQLFVDAKIGVRLAYDDEQDRPVSELLDHAGIALHRAKESQTKTTVFFKGRFKDRIERRLERLTGLQQALEHDSFELYFQPIVDLESRKPVFWEALLRWHRPDGHLAGPSEVIPLAEDSGIILPITEWVVEEACRVMHSQSGATDWKDARISINLSGLHARRHDVPERLAQRVREAGQDPGRFLFELTETRLAESKQAGARMLDALHDVGFSTAIDDFGTGYSALDALDIFDVDYIKIDKAFVQADPSNHKWSVVRMLADMADALGVDLIAEGIENQDQHEALRGLGIPLGQGYLYSRPKSL